MMQLYCDLGEKHNEYKVRLCTEARGLIFNGEGCAWGRLAVFAQSANLYVPPLPVRLRIG